MDEYKILRVETDTNVVASVVVAYCRQDQKFYAEYLVLYELLRSSVFRSWHDTKQTGEAKIEKILSFALDMAKERMTREGLGDINRKRIGDGIAYGDDQDIEVLKDREVPK